VSEGDLLREAEFLAALERLDAVTTEIWARLLAD